MIASLLLSVFTLIAPAHAQHEVLGIDMTLSPSAALDTYRNQGAKECKGESEDPNCLHISALGSLAGPKPIVIEYFADEPVLLQFDVNTPKVPIDNMIAQTQKLYKQKPERVMTNFTAQGEVKSKYCVYRFKVAGGVMEVMTETSCKRMTTEKNPTAREKFLLDRIAWFSPRVHNKRVQAFHDMKNEKSEEEPAPAVTKIKSVGAIKVIELPEVGAGFKEDLHKVLKTQMPGLQRCLIGKLLAKTPELLVITAELDGIGQVQKMTTNAATIHLESAENCVIDRLQWVAYPGSGTLVFGLVLKTKP